MNFIEINSSNISGAYHDGEDLYLRFVKGPIYRYIEVPYTVYEQMLEAPSVGKFFHAEIRPNYETHLYNK